MTHTQMIAGIQSLPENAPLPQLERPIKPAQKVIGYYTRRFARQADGTYKRVYTPRVDLQEARAIIVAAMGSPAFIELIAVTASGREVRIMSNRKR